MSSRFSTCPFANTIGKHNLENRFYLIRPGTQTAFLPEMKILDTLFPSRIAFSLTASLTVEKCASFALLPRIIYQSPPSLVIARFQPIQIKVSSGTGEDGITVNSDAGSIYIARAQQTIVAGKSARNPR